LKLHIDELGLSGNIPVYFLVDLSTGGDQGQRLLAHLKLRLVAPQYA
jgi:hypothetical protein